MPNSILRGVIAPNLTPFNQDLSVATDLYVAHARKLLIDGCVGLAPFGTTGEALSIGVDERIDILDQLIAAGVDPACLIPGTGLTSLPDTARLTRAVVKRGCAGALVLPPFFYKNPTDEGLFAYYATLIDKVASDRLRIYLYHIPQVAGVGVPVDVAARLRREFPQTVVGIKDSSGDWDNTSRLLEIDGLVVYPGSELPVIEAMEKGAPGCITATANLNAGPIAEVIKLMGDADRQAAQTRLEQPKAVRQILKQYITIPAQKRWLAITTGEERWANVRPPLMPMSQEDGRKLADRLREEGGLG